MDKRLSPLKVKAIQALIMHPKLQDAADAAGISLSTLKRWKKDPMFQDAFEKAFNDLQNERHHANVRAIINLDELAIRKLEKLANDETLAAALQLKISTEILELSNKYHDRWVMQADVKQVIRMLADYELQKNNRET